MSSDSTASLERQTNTPPASQESAPESTRPASAESARNEASDESLAQVPHRTETAEEKRSAESSGGARPGEERSTFTHGKIQIGSRRPPMLPSRSSEAGSPATPEPASSPAPDVKAESPSADEATDVAIDPSTASLPTPRAKVERPSKRAPLSPDLERELEAAFAGASVDQLIARQAVVETGEPLEPNSRHHGQVVRLDDENVFVSLGGRNEAIIPARQFEQLPEVGSTLEVVVKQFHADDGLYEAALPGATVEVSDWSDLTEGAVVEARVTGSNTGGLECKVNSIKGFIPASQIGRFRVEEFADYIDQKLLCVVTEANPRRRNLVLSHRAYLEREREEQRQQLLDSLEVGQTHEGVVRSVRDFGAFVDIGGIDGLVHVSQLSWDRINHPSEVLKEGDRVRVKIEKVDPQTGKIGLSYRDLQDHPWTNVESRIPVGTVVTGTVSRIAKFGAFVKLAPGIEGLIHISELSHHRVPNVSSVVSEGQEVQVKVLSVDAEAQRIALSMKELLAKPAEEEAEADVESAEEQAVREQRQKPTGPLRGGMDRQSGGDHFGLRW